ncbi:DUF1566 domain-containing protein [Vibrio sp. SCSIO 43140]|uniref:Lcl C-terminal domain-containing protein n=1 Tax=Vibrio sp. SCSIO 43140 TaxID=2819100 RepID=UPI0020754A85|nr:DUF1566 domain-containing protein [Vibrio sp. SCSIO 43140]USD58891.1 DUF1566 domain-containing protein [Vibrio sp. SCSIO 43140]
MMKLLTHVAVVGAAIASSAAFAQTCSENITPSHPEGQYIADNGTVTDVVNGLEWRLCTLGQTANGTSCSGTPTSYQTWQQALQAASLNTSFGGFDDWRLPNIKELASLVEHSCIAPAIDLTYFPDTPSSPYWTNTPDGFDVNTAVGLEGLLIDFNDGTEFVTDTVTRRYIRMVRKLN